MTRVCCNGCVCTLGLVVHENNGFLLCPQASGLKLRLSMLDTILLRDGRVIGHYYTNKDGVVCKFSPHEVTRASVYQRLAAQHTIEPAQNPFGYVALAHFPSGVSRLLKRPELQELVRRQ